MAELVLLGTVHHQEGGFLLLQGALEEMRPCALSLELSPQSLRWRQREGPALRRRLRRHLQLIAREKGLPWRQLYRLPAIAGIRRLLLPPYEYRAARAYADGAGIPLRLIDRSWGIGEKFRHIDRELLCLANLRQLLELEEVGETFHREGAAMARALLLSHLPREVSQGYVKRMMEQGKLGARDRSMARTIRRLMRGVPGGRLVHVGGWVHLLDDPKGQTLFCLLKDLNPRRRLLGCQEELP